MSLFEMLFKQTNTTVHRLVKIFGHIYMCLTIVPFHCNKRENVMVFLCFLFWEDTYFPTAMTLAISSLVPFMETFPNLRTRWILSHRLIDSSEFDVAVGRSDSRDLSPVPSIVRGMKCVSVEGFVLLAMFPGLFRGVIETPSLLVCRTCEIVMIK